MNGWNGQLYLMDFNIMAVSLIWIYRQYLCRGKYMVITDGKSLDMGTRKCELRSYFKGTSKRVKHFQKDSIYAGEIYWGKVI